MGSLCEASGNFEAKLHFIHVILPFLMPDPNMRLVSATAELTCTGEGLTAPVFSAVVAKCMSKLDTQTLIVFERVVRNLTPEAGDTTS